MYYLYVQWTVRSSWEQISGMTARQAETILMLSDFLEKRPSGDSKHCEG
jgi:hypothetical protein